MLDDSPMLLVGLVPEQEVSRIQVGAAVEGILLNGQRVSGTVTFLSAAADPVSRSYRFEVEVDPSDLTIREGITTEILVDADEVMAHRIPSSALTLDDNGDIGVKLIEAERQGCLSQGQYSRRRHQPTQSRHLGDWSPGHNHSGYSRTGNRFPRTDGSRQFRVGPVAVS